jgi:hypothetical protein
MGVAAAGVRRRGAMLVAAIRSARMPRRLVAPMVVAVVAGRDVGRTFVVGPDEIDIIHRAAVRKRQAARDPFADLDAFVDAVGLIPKLHVKVCVD